MDQLLVRACALLLLFQVGTGCSDGTGPQDDSRLTGRWAGAPWVGEADAVFVGAAGADTLYLFGVRPVNAGPLPEEILRVRVLFSGPGTYQLAPESVEYALLTGGDVVSGGYTGQSPSAGTLVVESYDPATRLIAGSVAFDAVAASEYRPYGSTAQFEDGRFRVSVRRSQ